MKICMPKVSFWHKILKLGFIFYFCVDFSIDIVLGVYYISSSSLYTIVILGHYNFVATDVS